MKEEVKFLKTSDLSKLRATLKINEGNLIINEFQKDTLEYLKKIETNKPVYQSESRNKFTIRKKIKDLTSLISWNGKNLNANVSQGIINAKIRGNYLTLEVLGDHGFVQHFYEFVQDP